MTLSLTAAKWLKTFHIFLACVWGGGASSLFAVHCLFSPETGMALHSRNQALIHIDSYVIAPASAGCLLTGLVYSHFTKWGYARYYWVMLKWVLLILFLVTGVAGFIPWLDALARFSHAIHKYTRIDPSYDASMEVHFVMAVFQIALVFFLVAVSVFKPWGKTRWFRKDTPLRRSRLPAQGRLGTSS